MLLEQSELTDQSDDLVPLTNINAATLSKIIEWANHHKNDEPIDQRRWEFCRRPLSDWDRQFLELPQPLLFDIILAANYLDMRELLDAACKIVARMIEDKSPDEIRKHFNIQNDFTKEEEEEAREALDWVERKYPY